MAAGTKWRTVFFVCATITLGGILASKEVMKNLTGGFAKVMETCKKEVGVGDHIIQDFYNFWREDYQLVNTEMGCMIICMATKLNLVTEDNKMHHGKAHEFAKAHGADDDMAKQLVTMLHECEKTHADKDDPCVLALEVAKCFRIKIHDLKWAPSMETILEEIMTEVKT